MKLFIYAIVVVAVAIPVTVADASVRANILVPDITPVGVTNLDSSINNHPGFDSGLVLNEKTYTNIFVRTVTTDVFDTRLCYIVASSLVTISATTTIEVNEAPPAPGICRKRRWAFENAIDGRISGPNDILASAVDTDSR